MKFRDYQAIYKKKTGLSKRLYLRSKQVFAGGINHNIRYFSPYPFYVQKAIKNSLFDVDGNVLTDYWMGHWALILGHSHPAVVSTLSKQVRSGVLFGTANALSVDLAEAIQRLIPKAELMRFSSTGSEATMYAVRLARASTGKRVIAKVIGGWHGFNTTLLQSVNYPFEYEESLGLIQEEEQFVESLPFNDLGRSLKILESIKDDLAGIIVEPVLGAGGCVPATREYLVGLQEFARKNSSIFILDEIVTGFRLSIHGAMSIYNLDPDLFTLGKIIGGGMPVGLVCGRKEIMSLADPVLRDQKYKRCSIGGGTFSANPATMSAGLATLKHLKNHRQTLYTRINDLGTQARKRISDIFRDSKFTVKVSGTGSLFMPHFLGTRASESKISVDNALSVAASNQELLVRYHMLLMVHYNIFFLPGKMGCFSEAHTAGDLERLIEATESIVSSDLLIR
jgi:glutamate-1-semialdehyde 2,1-aminomutase